MNVWKISLVIGSLMLIGSCTQDDFDDLSIETITQDIVIEDLNERNKSLDDLNIDIGQIRDDFSNSKRNKKISQFLKKEGAQSEWESAYALGNGEQLVYFPLVNDEEVVGLLGCLKTGKGYEFKLTDRDKLQKNVRKSREKEKGDWELLPLEAMAMASSDAKFFPHIYDPLLNKYIQEFIKESEKRRTKCQDVYQCTEYYNDWIIVVGDNVTYEQSQIPYHTDCVWLYTTCSSTNYTYYFQYPDGGGSSNTGNTEKLWTGDGLGANLCLPSFTKIGGGKYVQYSNLGYNFMHRRTAIQAFANINNLCFQFSDYMSDGTIEHKFNLAMENAILSTEAWLDRNYFTGNPVNPSSLNSVWKRYIQSGISSQFGSSASISTSCYGVPPSPANWGC